MNKDKTLDELRELVDRFIACWLPGKSQGIEKMIREDFEELIAKAQESGRIEERDRVVTDGEAVMFVDPDGRPMQPIRGTG